MPKERIVIELDTEKDAEALKTWRDAVEDAGGKQRGAVKWAFLGLLLNR